MNKLYRFFVLISLALVTVVLTAGLAAADVFTFTATLSGGNEVPANASPAIGMATIIWDDEGTLDFPLHIEFSGLSSTQVGCHIHNAPAGVNGPVIFAAPLGSPVDTVVPMDLAMLANLAGSNLYLNVHSETFPGGEIRGQFVLSDTVDSEQGTWGSVKSLYR